MTKEIIYKTVKGSSNIVAIGHDDDGVLGIKFKNRKEPGQPGPEYHYQEVNRARYNQFLEAKSKGEYFAKYIRNNPFITATKVGK